MTRTKRLDQITDFGIEALLKALSMHDLAAHFTTDKDMRDDLVPSVLEHMLKLNGMLRANPPAGGTAGTARHVVKQRLHSTGLLGLKSPSRTVLDTRKTAVTFFIHLEIDHFSRP
jgi:hypothetical protein